MSSTTPAMGSMALIGGVIVVIIVIAAAVFLLGGKTNAPATTTVLTSVSQNTNSTANNTQTTAQTTAVTTAATTTASGTQTNTDFQSWEGQNLSLTTFGRDLGQVTFAKLTSVNSTYDYNVSITEEAQGTTNLNGVLTEELYQNSTRTDSNLTYSGYQIQAVEIYNASSHDSYVCSSYGSSYTCYLSSVNESASGDNSGIDYVGSEAGSNSTSTGYFSNIQVTSSSVNGQPCTLITGDLYIDSVSMATSASSARNYTLSGTMNSCVSTQNDLALKTGLVGTTTSTSDGSTIKGNFSYTETWVKSGPAPTASITVLPGPISGSV